MVNYLTVNLRSRPLGKTFQIPVNYAGTAIHVINTALGPGPGMLAVSAGRYPCLRNPGILATALELAGEKRSPEIGRLMDLLHLRIAAYGNDHSPRSEDPEAQRRYFQVSRELSALIAELESGL